MGVVLAAARGFARSTGSASWWAMPVSIASGLAGLLIAAPTWARTATGPTVILRAFVWFRASQAFAALQKRGAP